MKTREKVKKNIEEGTHYYAGQKKGYWWKYLLAFLIIAIYLILEFYKVIWITFFNFIQNFNFYFIQFG